MLAKYIFLSDRDWRVDLAGALPYNWCSGLILCSAITFKNSLKLLTRKSWLRGYCAANLKMSGPKGAHQTICKLTNFYTNLLDVLSLLIINTNPYMNWLGPWGALQVQLDLNSSCTAKFQTMGLKISSTLHWRNNIQVLIMLKRNHIEQFLLLCFVHKVTYIATVMQN